jgi:hypothetical protein
MIKHRFIVGADDFKVFAAIPTESKLLTWKRWRPRTNWAKLRLIIERSGAVFGRLSGYWDDVARGYRAISNAPVPGSLKQVEEGQGERDTRRVRAAQAVESEILASTCSAEADTTKRILSSFDLMSDDEMRGQVATAYAVIEPERPRDLERDVVAYVSNLRKFLVRVAGGVSTGSVDNLVEQSRAHIDILGRNLRAGFKDERLQILGKEDATVILAGVKDLYDAYEVLMVLFNKILDEHALAAMLVKEIDEASSLALPADLECPVGIPFAAYTIEIGSRHINVVEGLAWTDGLEATEAEKRVAEIVSQMMVERSLNPKAPTRISVREVDPKQAHEQRQAEARGGPPRVRTIKFHVSPPRYLRDAAEVILASPRKAHWVVGHWRNQPFGEGRTQRHQTWIKPHIRGLGEAGATTVKMVANAEAQKHGSSEAE